MKSCTIPLSLGALAVACISCLHVPLTRAEAGTDKIPAYLQRLGVSLRPRPVQKTAAQSPIVREVKKQLARKCIPAQSATSPYAYTVYFRRGYKPKLSAGNRVRLTAAGLSQDPKTAAVLTKPLRESRSPEARYAANLTVAYVALNMPGKPDWQAIARFARAMGKDRRAVQHSIADWHYLHALLHLNAERRREAAAEIDLAIRAEPKFFNAILIGLNLAVSRAEKTAHRGLRSCRGTYHRLMGLALRLMRLEPCPRQAAHMLVYFQRRFSNPESVGSVQALGVYLAVLARRPEAARARLGRFLKNPRVACRHILGRTLKQVIGLLP